MQKKYRVLFFTTSIGQNGLPLSSALPNPLVDGLPMPAQLQPRTIEGVEFQVRDFTRIGTTHVWKGVFGRLRDDAPNLVNAHGHEAAIPLHPNDRLLEKSHFLYFSNHDILVWQVNTDVGYISRFTLYLGELLNMFVQVNAAVGANALERVIQGTVKNIECKVATPRIPLGNVPNYSQAMFDLMNGVHGSTIKVNISAGRGTLGGNVRRLIQWAVQNPDTKTLKAKIVDEVEPIDLLVDRITDTIHVDLDGHYPNPVDVYAALDQAFTNNRQELAPYFRQAA